MPRECVVGCVTADIDEIYPPNETPTPCSHGQPLASSGAEVPGWRTHFVLPATSKVFYLEPKLGTPSLHAGHMVDTAHRPPPQFKQHTMAVSPLRASSRARSVRLHVPVLHAQAPRNDPTNRKPETWSGKRLPDFDRCTQSACRLKKSPTPTRNQETTRDFGRLRPALLEFGSQCVHGRSLPINVDRPVRAG